MLKPTKLGRLIVWLYYTSSSPLALMALSSKRMNVKRLILTPGDFLARRFDRGYARFMARMRRKIKKGNPRLAIYSLLARAECVLAFVVGASASYFGLVIVVLLVLCFYPLIALGDPFMWRRVYGRLAAGVGYKASFLLNLDMLYWFAIGWIVGVLLVGA